MGTPRAENAVDDIALSYRAALGDRLKAIYLYGSLVEGLYDSSSSDINLLVVIDSPAALGVYKDNILPIWEMYRKTLVTNPIISSPAALNRHLLFNPLLASHMRRVGQLVYGTEYIWPDPNVDIIEHMVRLARHALEYSALLGPSLLTDIEKKAANIKFRRVYKQIFGQTESDTQSTNELVCQLIQFSTERIADFPDLLEPDLFAFGAPPLIDRLLSIYEADNRIYLVFPDLPPQEINKILSEVDWAAVADRVAGSYSELRIATAAQLRLILRYEYSADYKLNSFSHIWGVDILDELKVSDWSIFRSQGRLASEMLLIDLPSSYVYSNESDLAMLVHDYQNKLLTIQLRHELLCRMMNLKLEFPEQKLPSREAPIDIRLQGIFDHLEWWVNFYFAKMNQSMEVE